jgi:fatty-acyl-CoA synthase
MPGKVSRSYAFRGSEKPLIGETIGDMFDEIAATYPDNDAVVSLHQCLRYTYRDLQNGSSPSSPRPRPGSSW